MALSIKDPATEKYVSELAAGAGEPVRRQRRPNCAHGLGSAVQA